MTISFISQHEAATGEPSLFDSLSRLVPKELQREYYLDNLLHNFKADVLKIWLPLAACGAFILGLSGGVSLERYRDASVASERYTSPDVTVPSSIQGPEIAPQPSVHSSRPLRAQDVSKKTEH